MDDPRVDAVVAELRRSLAYWQVRRAVKEAVIKPDVRLDDDVESGVRAVMESAGLANRVRNFAFAMRERLPADGARASAASTARRSSDRGGADVARDASVHADADEDEDASGAFPPIVETHRAWKREIIARLERLAASSGVPLAQAAEGTRPPDDGADADRARGRRAGAESRVVVVGGGGGGGGVVVVVLLLLLLLARALVPGRHVRPGARRVRRDRARARRVR